MGAEPAFRSFPFPRWCDIPKNRDRSYQANLPAVRQWLLGLQLDINARMLQIFRSYTIKMLNENPSRRPSAKDLTASFRCIPECCAAGAEEPTGSGSSGCSSGASGSESSGWSACDCGSLGAGSSGDSAGASGSVGAPPVPSSIPSSLYGLSPPRRPGPEP